jgi:hypothetical protein
MTTPTEPPRQLVGFLQAGETTTRTFSSELPDTHVAVLARVPGREVHITDQTSTQITLENPGPETRFYTVLFVTRAVLEGVASAGKLLGFMLDAVKGGDS